MGQFAPILTFLTITEERGFHGYKQADMAAMTFHDLPELELGRRYLYTHQDNCQHLFCIAEVRHPFALDRLARNEYPLHSFQGKISRRKCSVCQVRSAMLVTRGVPFLKSYFELLCNYCAARLFERNLPHESQITRYIED